MAAGGGGNIGINVTKVVYYRRTRRKQGSSRAAESGGANFKCYEGTKVPSYITRETEADAARIAASGLKPKLSFVLLALDLEQLSPRVCEVATHVPQVHP